MNRRDELDALPPRAEAGGGAVWRVLVVDDEPEVLEVTQLILGRMQFRGEAVVVDGVGSAAAARDHLARHPDTAVVLLDVVMEQDDAGLRLIHHIRDEAGLRMLQIVIRTGQPGVAPEAEVIAAYDINGYYLKTELTAQRLRSVVTFALRNWHAAHTAARVAGAPAASDAVLEAVRRCLVAEPVIEARVDLASGRVSACDIGQPCLPGFDREQYAALLARLAPDERLACDRRLLAALEQADAARIAERSATRLAVRLISPGVGGEDGLALFERLIERKGLAVGRFELCLGERDLSAEWIPRIEALRRRGVTITLEGVGLGALSLPDIRRLRPDIIALHPAIVAGVHADAEQAAIVRSVIALAHTLGARALARGVASSEDVQFCKWEGCECAQGLALSDSVSPLPAAPAAPRLH